MPRMPLTGSRASTMPQVRKGAASFSWCVIRGSSAATSAGCRCTTSCTGTSRAATGATPCADFAT